jgi:hypothetical protein
VIKVKVKVLGSFFRCWVFVGPTSVLVLWHCLATGDLTELFFQKGEQIRQFGKTPALTSVWAFEGCSPDKFALALYLPQTQQVRYVTSLFPGHALNPLSRPVRFGFP